MKNNQKIENSEEQIKEFELAYQISEEVVEELNFKDVSDYVVNENIDLAKNNFYKNVFENNIKIYGEISSIYGEIEVQFSLTYIALDILRLCKMLLDDKTAPEVLHTSVMFEIKKRNLDMLTFFDLKPSEVDETIIFTTKNVLKMFIQNIPLFTRSGIIDALGHSKIGYCLYFIKSQLNEHWEKLGFSKDFNLITEPQLDSVKKYNADQKKWFLGEKKQLLNIEILADQSDALKIQYKDAKVAYFAHKNSFDMLFPNASDEEWNDKWIEICMEKFPTLHYKALNTIQNFRPYELANIHLAEVFGYDEEYMRKTLIPKSRKLRNKNKNGTF